ncbi:hypothetical protein B0T17DRAFT_490512, partial [Bombardia bombarda]
GCSTCRKRKVKCDESKPICSPCARLLRKCDWGSKPVPLKERKEQAEIETRSRPPRHIVSKRGIEDTTANGGHLSSLTGPLWLTQDSNSYVPAQASHPSLFTPNSSTVQPLHECQVDDMLSYVSFFPSPFNEMGIGSASSFLASLPSVAPLTLEDHQALGYYQQEIGFGFGSKSPTWSTHAILLKTACSNRTVLHLLLAASSGEISWQRGAYYSMLDNAEENYKRGQQSLAEAITDPGSDPLVIMASFWFLYLYQRRRPATARITYSVLSRLMCDYLSHHRLHQILSSTAPEHRQQAGRSSLAYPQERKALLARLIIWLFWVDTQSCFQGEGGSMARLLAQSVSSRGIVNMYEVSREALQLNWEGYPDDELVDDLKNSSALELIHHTWVLVQEINEATVGERSCDSLEGGNDSFRGIKTRIDALRRRFPISSVFRLTESSAKDRDRLLCNSDWAVANYYALSIYYSRCSSSMFSGDADTDEEEEEEDTTGTAETLLILIQKTLASGDRGQLDRMQWPLFWVGVETTDSFKQNWIADKLVNQGLHEAFRVLRLEQLSGGRLGIERIRRICQTACADVPGAELGVLWTM